MQNPSIVPPSVGGYRLVRELGRGGMSVVYLAENEVIRRRVAVKMLHPSFSRDESLMQRFLSEARIVASLQHPNIVQLMDVAPLPDGQLYMVLEYVEGVSLNRRLYEGPVPRATSLAILKQLCSAVHAAHAAGIVHRDIKAENVMLTGDALSPVVKLLDFGVAKLAYEQAVTLPGVMLGTPHTMAPEQIRGKAVDGRADLEALGVLAYVLFSGRLPFTGDLNEILYRQAHELPEPLTDLPPALWNVVARAMAKDPNERFQSGQELADAIEQVTSQDFDAPERRPEPPFVVHLAGRQVRVCFSSSERWERVRAEQVEHRRFFVPLQSLPDGALSIAFEVNGAPVLEADAEVSVRISSEQAQQWRTEPGCALALRRLQTPQGTHRASGLESVVRSHLDRIRAHHYEFLAVTPDCEGSVLLAKCEALRERLASVPPGSPLRALADKVYLKLQHARRDLCDLESRAAYDAELGNFRGVARALRMGLSTDKLERARSRYAQQHPEKVARAASLLLESELFLSHAQSDQRRRLLEQALTEDPLSLVLHRQFWAPSPARSA